MHLSSHTQLAPAFHAALIASILALPAVAQPYGSRHPATELKIATLTAGQTDLETNGTTVGDLAITMASLNYDTPLATLSGGTRLSAGIGYRAFFLDVGGGAPLPDQLESLETHLTARHNLNERWSLLGTLSPGAHAANGAFGSDSLNLSAILLASYKASNTLTLGAGFVYDSLSENLPLMPVAGLRWDFAPDWTFNLAFPSSGISWTATDRLTLHLTLDLDVGSYYIENDPEPALGGKPSLNDTVLDFTAVSGALGADYRLNNALSLSASIGYNFTRTLDYDARNYKIEAKDSAPIVRLGLTYQF